jgi:hypothetical protein
VKIGDVLGQGGVFIADLVHVVGEVGDVLIQAGDIVIEVANDGVEVIDVLGERLFLGLEVFDGLFERVDLFSFFSQLMIFGVNFDLEFSDGHLEFFDHALKVFGSLLEFLVLFVILSDGRDVGEGVVG